jgi:hypothetical protein
MKIGIDMRHARNVEESVRQAKLEQASALIDFLNLHAADGIAIHQSTTKVGVWVSVGGNSYYGTSARDALAQACEGEMFTGNSGDGVSWRNKGK